MKITSNEHSRVSEFRRDLGLAGICPAVSPKAYRTSTFHGFGGFTPQS